MLKCLNVKMKKGFTLLEVIVAIFLIMVGVAASLILINKTISQMALSTSQLTAAYLAQEGIEIVRNIRDTNWIENAPSWSDGLGAGDWEADYNDQALTSYVFPGRFLKFDGTFYNYDAGTDTKFKRKITIVPDGSDKLKVTVSVDWVEKQKNQSVIVKENLYNWR